MKSKNLKKLVSMILAMLLTLSIGITAYAANSDTQKGTINISGCQTGEDYTIYQLFEMTYSDADPKSYSYKVISGWEDFLAQYPTYFTLTNNQYVDPSSGIFNVEDDAEFMSSFAQAALEYAKNNSIAGTTKTADGEGDVTFTNLPLGYYLGDTSLGSLCMLSSTDPIADVQEKNGTPTVTKYIDEDNQNKEDIDSGTQHTYILYIDSFKGVSHLKLDDVMDPEIQYVDGSINVTIINKDGEVLKTLTENKDYYVEVTTTSADETMNEHDYASGSPEIIVSFFSGEYNGDTYSEFDFSNYSASDRIKITYSCDVITEGDEYVDDIDDLLNSAQVLYANASKSDWVYAEVETFGFEILKKNTDDVALSDAAFELTNADGETAYFLIEDLADVDHSIYLFEGWDLEEDDGYTASLVSDDNGMIYIEGLNAGTYTMKETNAPDGYNKLKKDFSVLIAEDGAVSLISSDDSVSISSKTITVINYTGSLLPNTGGIGTTIFYIIGGILVLAVIVILITRKRMESSKKNKE